MTGKQEWLHSFQIKLSAEQENDQRQKGTWWVFFFLNLLYCCLLDVVSFFLEREGREKERERNISVRLPLARPLLGSLLATQACALTGNWTSQPPFGLLAAATQSTEPHQPGRGHYVLISDRSTKKTLSKLCTHQTDYKIHKARPGQTEGSRQSTGTVGDNTLSQGLVTEQGGSGQQREKETQQRQTINTWFIQYEMDNFNNPRIIFFKILFIYS